MVRAGWGVSEPSIPSDHDAGWGWGVTDPCIPYPPSRIIVGEVRQEESLDLLIALNSGLAGICTLHAHSARGAVTKMRTLPLLAGENRRPRHPSPARAARVPQRTAWRAELGQRYRIPLPGRAPRAVADRPIDAVPGGGPSW